MGDIIMKKITKRNCYQFLSILIFSGAILAVFTKNIIFGYALIVLGYCFLRKSDLEDWFTLMSALATNGCYDVNHYVLLKTLSILDTIYRKEKKSKCKRLPN